MKYPSKALEVVLDVFSYPRGTTEHGDTTIISTLVAALTTNSTTASPGRPRNTRTVQ